MPDLIRVEPIALLPTQAGCAVFLGDGNKAIVFYIDPAVGASINASMAGQQPPRPLTHDLFLQAMDTFPAERLYQILKAIFDNKIELSAVWKGATALTPAMAVGQVTPDALKYLHPGAQKFFKEKGALK